MQPFTQPCAHCNSADRPRMPNCFLAGALVPDISGHPWAVTHHRGTVDMAVLRVRA